MLSVGRVEEGAVAPAFQHKSKDTIHEPRHNALPDDPRPPPPPPTSSLLHPPRAPHLLGSHPHPRTCAPAISGPPHKQETSAQSRLPSTPTTSRPLTRQVVRQGAAPSPRYHPHLGSVHSRTKRRKHVPQMHRPVASLARKEQLLSSVKAAGENLRRHCHAHTSGSSSLPHEPRSPPVCNSLDRHTGTPTAGYTPDTPAVRTARSCIPPSSPSLTLMHR